MKYISKFAIVAALCLLLAEATTTARVTASNDTWTRVRTKHFTLVGDAGEGELRRLAVRLEQFRHAFARLAEGFGVGGHATPTTVVVFKSYESYGPFRAGDSSGYFQSGEGAHYITLTAERIGDEDAYAVAYHEYLHLLVRERLPHAPLWLNEGLAEYYSTFEMSGGRRVSLGGPIKHHVRTLRAAERLLPLATLFGVEHSSPHYNERSKRGVFYAQSWALVQYLMSGEGTGRREQLRRYTALLAAGRAHAEALGEAFGDDLVALEGELKLYVSRNGYAGHTFTLDGRLSFDASMEIKDISEASALTHLADLLMHIQRLDEAEEYLRRALALEPHLADVRASLGMLRIRQGRMDEARKELETAVASETRNYLAHFYYAQVISQAREGRSASGGYLPETIATVRTHLRKVIELAPQYGDAYDLLALVEIASGDLDGAEALLRSAVSLAPGHAERYALTLAQVKMHRGDYDGARKLVEPVAREGVGGDLRRNAAELLAAVHAQEALELRRASAASPRGRDEGGEGEEEYVYEPPAASDVRPKAEGQEQARGDLVEVECAGESVLLHLLTEGRVLKFRANNFERLPLVSYDPALAKGIGRKLTCGRRITGNHVLLTYRPLADAQLKAEGEVVAVDFIPRNWR